MMRNFGIAVLFVLAVLAAVAREAQHHHSLPTPSPSPSPTPEIEYATTGPVIHSVQDDPHCQILGGEKRLNTQQVTCSKNAKMAIVSRSEFIVCGVMVVLDENNRWYVFDGRPLCWMEW